MSKQSQPAGRSSKPHGPAPAWLRFSAVCVVLVVVPVALYLFLYQRSRVQDATIRNFRALDAAADRVDEVLSRLSSVVNGSSFGMSPTMLDEVTELLTDRAMDCGPDRDLDRAAWRDPPEFPRHLFRSRGATATQRLEYRYWLAAHQLFRENKRNDGATQRLWDQLHCLIDTHRRYSEPDESIEVQVRPSPRVSLRPLHPGCDIASTTACIRLRDLLAAEPCQESAPSPRLGAAQAGMGATIVDCRRLRERHPELHDALKLFRGSEAVIKAIDLFAIRSTAQLDRLIKEATGYLSRSFDSHLIADSEGRILFQSDASLRAETETEESRVATPAFSSHVDISELLRLDSAPADGGGAGGAAASAPVLRGRSFVQVVGVEDIDLRVFVHPFVVDNVSTRGEAARSPDGGGGSSSGAERPTFYLVGIVDDSEFRSAAIELRLALVVDATLALLVLLTLAPLLWLWTAGDRLAVRRPALTVVCATPVVGVVLLTVLACGLVTNRVDGHVLDGALVHVSDRIATLFDRELRSEIRDLQRQVSRLLDRARAANEEPPRTRDGKLHAWEVRDLNGRSLTRLERRLYCDDSDRDVDYDPRRPERRGAFLLSRQGKQHVCLGGTRVARNAKLDLAFREYFTGPMAGAVWQPPTRVRTEAVPCRIGDVQDEESLIPCLVDDLHEPGKRLFGVGYTSRSSASLPDVPYFLERIDSVVGGRKETMLAVNSGRPETPVAAMTVPLYALDRAVPPHHVHFAVVDREAGRTLFHSDDRLAMTTNFAEDTGGDAALWSLMRSGARDTIGLVYAGAPIRAYVRPLREGMPWTLIVYRGHELEDRLAAVTAALTIFSALAWPFLLTLAAGILLLAVYWWRPDLIKGIPITLGRAMATGSRFGWLFVGILGVVLVFLLCGSWLAWRPGPPSNPWIPWHPWSPDSGWNPWRVFPFFALGSVVAVMSFLVCCVLGLRREAAGDPPRVGTRGRTLTLAVMLIGLAVAPPALWFGHYRAELGVGLNHYMVDRTLESVAREREDHRREKLSGHGAAVAPAGDRTRPRLQEEPRLRESWVDKALRAAAASSRLSNELLIYRALPPAAADGVASLYGVFATTFGYDVGWPLSGPGAGRFVSLSAALLLLMALLVGTVAYSLCALCTIVRSRRHGLVKLPDACRLAAQLKKAGHPSRGPLRAIVLCASRVDREEFVQQLTSQLGLIPHRHRVYKQDHGWPHYPVDWLPAAKTASATQALYIFDDLQEVLENNGKGRALFGYLEDLVSTQSSVLVWSRVLPDHWCSARSGPADGWFAVGGGDDPDRRARWSRMVRKFGSYRLCSCKESLRRFDQLMQVANPKPKPPREVEEKMRNEAATNPDLLHVAMDVIAAVGGKGTPGARKAEEAADIAVTTFRKSAASRFNEIWADSTHDERLQLYALANGGVVNSRRAAALSSLVNRGIVRECGDTGVIRLGGEAFREFIEHDVDHGELDAWRKEGGGGAWRFIWPPLAIGAVLGLAFLALANPEMRGTLLTALLGLVPVVLPALRGGSGGGTSQT